jgi:hypothetical protein
MKWNALIVTNLSLKIHMQHLETQFGRNTVKDFSDSSFSEPILKPLVLKANFSDVNFDAQHIPPLVGLPTPLQISW